MAQAAGEKGSRAKRKKEAKWHRKRGRERTVGRRTSVITSLA